MNAHDGVATTAHAEVRHLIWLATAERLLRQPAYRRAVMVADGRIAFPDIIQYRIRDGQVLDVPPLDAQPYTPVIHDRAAEHDLRRSGRLGLGHAYFYQARPVDNRMMVREMADDRAERKTAKQRQAACDSFNRNFPVGWTVLGSSVPTDL